MTESGTTIQRVLLVDDDAGSRLTLTALLEDEGFVVDEARSVADGALRISSGPPCAAVILDNHLGDGLGSELVPQLRATWPAVKILSLSGDAIVVEGSGFDGCVTKGAQFSVLLAALRALVPAPAR